MQGSLFLVSSYNEISFFHFSDQEVPFYHDTYDDQNKTLENWISNIKERFSDAHPTPNKIFVSSPRYTIIPNVLFSPNNSKQLFELNFKQIEHWEQVYFNFISSIKASVIFGKPLIAEKIKKQIDSSSSIAHLIPMLCDFSLKHCKSGIPFLFVHMNYANFILSIDGKLIAAVQFQYQAVEDIIYHLLANLKSHNIMSLSSLNLISLNPEIVDSSISEFLRKIDFSSNVEVSTKSIELLFKL